MNARLFTISSVISSSENLKTLSEWTNVMRILLYRTLSENVTDKLSLPNCFGKKCHFILNQLSFLYEEKFV
jgi:hypothetical protein